MNPILTQQENNQARCIDIIIPVKDGGHTLRKNIERWITQDLPKNWQCHIYLVDDGSTDGMPSLIKKTYYDDPKVNIVSNETSQGRAKARNQGADAGSGEFLAFFDADCSPTSNVTIKAFIHAVEQFDSKLLFGSLQATSTDFWGKYFQEVADRREQSFLTGDTAALTTANCVIERKLFYQAGKYDESYTQYGFEDRDLILRLLALYNAPHYVKNASVMHEDRLTLNAICEKMRIAGKYSSLTFQNQHPDFYRSMSFYQADIRHKPKAFIPAIIILRALKRPILLLANCLLKLPLPYKVKARTVRYCSGLFFAIGTSEKAS